jgi:hypothetical protein
MAQKLHMNQMVDHLLNFELGNNQPPFRNYYFQSLNSKKLSKKFNVIEIHGT